MNLTVLTYLLLVLCDGIGARAATSGRAEIEAKPLFQTPLSWLGRNEPGSDEQAALQRAIGVWENDGVKRGFVELENFLHDYPQSGWAPSLHVNMAEYYRNHGGYTLALKHWQLAWDETKGGNVADQKLAVRALAGWTRLLGSLGEKQKLDALFNEADALHLPLGSYATMISGTKEGLLMMNSQPGISYRCGSFALGHVLSAMGDKAAAETIYGVKSPDGGFYVAGLLALARTNKVDFIAAQSPSNAALVVPSVVHWKLNHYAAITQQRGDLYRVEDPTFEGHVWMDAETIKAESDGMFIIPGKKVPAGWRELSAAECENMYGKGYPSYMDDDGDSGPPNGCEGDEDSEDSSCDPPSANDGAGGGDVPTPPPCPNCGMPQWSISEPYITLWLKDTPLFYHQSTEKWMNLTLSYKSRGAAQSSVVGGFGDKLLRTKLAS